MNISTPPKRLTWDPVYPAPFESIWSILVKVVVLNNLPLKDLIRLITKDSDKSIRRSSIPNNSDWIDFERLASLLRVSKERLNGGTWESMGVRQPAETIASIRLCPECWKSGQHYSLFDMSILTHCPLHGCLLTQPCIGCASHTTFLLRRGREGSVGRFCGKCRRILPSRNELLGWSSDCRSQQSIEKYCHSVIDWWKSVEASLPERDDVLVDIFRTGKQTAYENRFCTWQLYYAIQSASSPLPAWQLSIKPEPVRFASQFLPSNYVFSDELSWMHREPRINDLDARGYRALRRQLFKKFIRRHKRCYNSLVHMSWEEAQSLDGDKVCLACLAFIAWRMSIEGLVRIEGLRYRRLARFELQLIGGNYNSEMPNSFLVRCAYFSFCGIWRDLYQLKGRKIVNIVQRGDYDGSNILYVRTRGAEGRINAEGLNPAYVRHISILYPDVLEQMQEPVARCIDRCGQSLNMIDNKQVGVSIRSGAFLNDHFLDNNRVMFHVGYPDRPSMTKSITALHL